MAPLRRVNQDLEELSDRVDDLTDADAPGGRAPSLKPPSRASPLSASSVTPEDVDVGSVVILGRPLYPPKPVCH